MQANLNNIPRGSMARAGRDMKCPNCGNEIHPGEAYCGQCGTPVVPPVPSTSTNQTEMMSTPSPNNGGLFNSYPVQQPSQASFTPPSSQQGSSQPVQSPQNSYGTRPFPTNTRPVSPQTGSFGPQQQGDFYQDATEAISLPSIPPQGYRPDGGYAGQQPFPATPPNSYPTMGASGPTQYGGQSGQYGFTGQQGLQGPQTPPFQPQGLTRPAPPSPQRQSGTTGIVIISILLALALIAIIGFGTLYFVRHSANQQTGQHAAALAATATASANNANANATTTANANATSTVTVATTPTVAPTATTAPSPTPTIVPTATPDANFTYCGQPCIANGYQTEYPSGWNQLSSGDGLSIQFINPAQADEFITFRTPQTPANSASDVVANDLQTNYANKMDYTPSPQSSSATISGETWIESYATYQGDTQKERIEVFGTIHAGKSYVIELQAPDAQFDQANSQYFVNVTGRFQFQQ